MIYTTVAHMLFNFCVKFFSDYKSYMCFRRMDRISFHLTYQGKHCVCWAEMHDALHGARDNSSPGCSGEKLPQEDGLLPLLSLHFRVSPEPERNLCVPEGRI